MTAYRIYRIDKTVSLDERGFAPDARYILLGSIRSRSASAALDGAHRKFKIPKREGLSVDISDD